MAIISAFPGGGGSVIQPGSTVPVTDDIEGAVGESLDYARADHKHPMIEHTIVADDGAEFSTAFLSPDREITTVSYVKKPVVIEISLPAGGDLVRTVEVESVVTDELSQEIHIRAKLSDAKAFTDAGVLLTGKTDGFLTFTLEKALEEDITIYATIWDLS